MTNNGSAYSRENRQMINSLCKNFEDYRNEMRREFSELKKSNEKLYRQLPNWAAWIMTGMGGTIGVLATLLARL